MGRKISGVILAVTGAVLAVGSAGAAPVEGVQGQIAGGKNVKTADAATQPTVKKGAAANVKAGATPGGTVSGSSASGVKVKTGATPSAPAKETLDSRTAPRVKQGSTPGASVATEAAVVIPPRTVLDPKFKLRAATGGAGV